MVADPLSRAQPHRGTQSGRCNSPYTQERGPMFPFIDVAQAAVGFALSMGIRALVFPFRGY